MSSLAGAVERLRDRGQLPTTGTVSVIDLLHRFRPNPKDSVRALLLTMFDRVAEKSPWAIILCRFKGALPNPSVEQPIEQLYRQAFTPGTGGMVEFWRDASLGAIDITGSRVFGWVEVEIPRTQAGMGTTSRPQLIEFAVKAAQRSGIDPLTGFHSQLAVYTQNWANDDPARPPGIPNWTPNDPLQPWWPTWIDGSAAGNGVCLTPPHNGNIIGHEMGHLFGMEHDVGPDLTTASDYSDPCCIMSQNGPFMHPTWQVPFGPAVCLPHLVQRNWMYERRIYYDAGDWLSEPEGIVLPLAPITRPSARANLGIRLAYKQDQGSWDYYLEYVLPQDWNRGVPGAPYLFIRRITNIPGEGNRPAYLGAIAIGAGTEFVEPSGNVKFRADLTDLPGPILKVTANKL